jgi:segregation and condensation protein B
MGKLRMSGRNSQRKIQVVHSDPAEAVAHEPSQGISLEALGDAYAQAMGAVTPKSLVADPQVLQRATQSVSALLNPSRGQTDGITVSAESILEAILFVGSRENGAIAPQMIADLLRDVSADELRECANQLNQRYQNLECVFEVVHSDDGLQLQLRTELASVHELSQSKPKESQLTQASVDCLSLVAYQPGITRRSLETQWNQPAGSVLSMLLRKGLLRSEASNDDAEGPKYFTTDRFLEILGIDSLDDLPRGDEL